MATITWTQAGAQATCSLGSVSAHVTRLSTGEHMWVVSVLSDSGVTGWARGYAETLPMAQNEAEGSLRRANVSANAVPNRVPEPALAA